MDINYQGITELASAGFLAIATLVLVLSFWLLKGVTTSNEYKSEEELKIRYKMVQMYMFGAFVVLMVGLFYSFFKPSIKVSFDVSPKDTEGLVVKAGGKEINLTKSNNVSLDDQNQISLDLVKIDRRLRELSRQVNYNKDVADGVKKELERMKKQQVKEDQKNISSEEEGI